MPKVLHKASFNKNDEVEVKPSFLCHESWMDPLSTNSKLYDIVKDKINSPEIQNVVFVPCEEYRYFSKFQGSAFIVCTNKTFKELASRFEEISGDKVNTDKLLEILNEFYNNKLIKSFNIIKPKQYALEKDENVYLIELGRYSNDYEIPDQYSTAFDRKVRIKKRPVKDLIRK